MKKSTLDSDITFVLFDGICALCNGFVKFIFKFDRGNKIKVAPLQSELAQKILKTYDFESYDLSSVVVIESGVVSQKFKAVVCILKKIGREWKFLAALLQFIPSVIGDFFYDIVAKTRYKIFGKYEQCPIPNKEHLKKFINESDLL